MTISIIPLSILALIKNWQLITVIIKGFDLTFFLNCGLILSGISLVCWVVVQFKQDQHKKSFEEMAHDSRLLAHELSHPLTSILFEVELLGQSLDLSQKDAQRVAKIRQILNISINLLHCFNQPRKKYQEESFDFNDVVALAISLLQYKAKQNNIKLKYLNQVKNPIKLRGKSCLFYQILANLIINSIESCQKKIPGREMRTIQIINKLEKNVVCISIKDSNSKSIKPHYFAKLINQASFSRPIEQGLGLLIVEDLVKNYFSGEIAYNSHSKKGNEVIVRLPALQPNCQTSN
ncbi:MAG: HAMP domain-containing sensor histidine kinase [Patescibacteria group bacterium]|nr:HAMP domain-containing sensor histidine kinase [Patescibacteria group bacterium]